MAHSSTHPLACGTARRHFADGIGSLGNPIGSPVDKLLVGLFRLRSLLGSLEDLLRQPETTTLQRLKVGAWAGLGSGSGGMGRRWNDSADAHWLFGCATRLRHEAVACSRLIEVTWPAGRGLL
jgi:hypothetical protein